ncbi:sigma-70 family RNA polymerase sigma factor [Candidatus Peregrinibacteria bacterium]|nr:sigma-70 family RNA polymerase sigma factor [Candidatus Peregrinibacteria bacterium]
MTRKKTHMKRKNKNFLKYYNTYFEKIYRYIFFRVGKDRALAEDLTSEVMIKAYEKFDTFNPEKNFSVWIYRIAHNHLVDHYKKVKVAQVPLDEIENILKTDDYMNLKIDTKMDLKKVETAIAKLPEVQREIVLMHYMHDLSVKEIAKVQTQSENNIRVILSRAVSRLKKQLVFLSI